MEVDEFLEIEFTQRNARFTGAEANLGIALHDVLRLNLGMDYVDAKDTDTTRTCLGSRPCAGA